MYFKINPTVGPANGGTSVNVTGKSICYLNDNITVIINGAKCSNVTVIEASTV